MSIFMDGERERRGGGEGWSEGEKSLLFEESSCAYTLFYLHVANMALLHITEKRVVVHYHSSTFTSQTQPYFTSPKRE